MKSFITGLIFFCSLSCAMAQSLGDQISKARIQMVKATAEFLTTDTATFKDVVDHSCSGCKSYENIEEFAKENNLISVEGLVEDFRKLPMDTTPANWRRSLNDFKDNIIKRITTGKKNRENRISLPDYKTYSDNLNRLTNGISVISGAATPDKGTQSSGKTSSKSVAATASKDSITNTPDETATGNNVPESSFIDNIMTWLPYFIAGVLLFALIALWNAFSKDKKTLSKLVVDKKTLESQVGQLKRTIADLERKNKQQEEELKNKEMDLQAVEARLLNVQKKKTQPENVIQPEPEKAAEQSVLKIAVQKPKPVAATIKYARNADLGDGFSNSGLLDAADDETIFELLITPNSNSGKFRITGQRGAQHYALSNTQYFLGRACQYNSFPSENATIRTDEEGVIKLNGNKWIIATPAKISFS